MDNAADKMSLRGMVNLAQAKKVRREIEHRVAQIREIQQKTTRSQSEIDEAWERGSSLISMHGDRIRHEEVVIDYFMTRRN